MTDAEHVEYNLDTQWKLYNGAIAMIAIATFKSKILPVLKEKNWNLMVTQVRWVVMTANGDMEVDVPALKGIEEIMSLPIPGVPSMDFGMIMPSYGYPNMNNNYEEEDG